MLQALPLVRFCSGTDAPLLLHITASSQWSAAVTLLGYATV